MLIWLERSRLQAVSVGHFWVLCQMCYNSKLRLSTVRCYLCQGGCVIVIVCYQLCAKTSRRICMKFSGNVGNGPVKKVVKFWWKSGSPSGYGDCFPDLSLLGDTESG